MSSKAKSEEINYYKGIPGVIKDGELFNTMIEINGMNRGIPILIYTIK
ncbi:hypothetical protein [Flavobacterium sp. ACAM 123]|nr:hypothetical protein [Flavobacterium sp. ACAM 123]